MQAGHSWAFAGEIDADTSNSSIRTTTFGLVEALSAPSAKFHGLSSQCIQAQRAKRLAGADRATHTEVAFLPICRQDGFSTY